MDVLVRDKQQILRSLAGLLVPLLGITLIYGMIAGLGFAALLRQQFGIQYPIPIAVAVLGPAWILAAVAYVRFMVNRISQSRLCLENDILISRGHTTWGLKERHWPLSEIVSITFGDELNAMERAAAWMSRIGVPKTGSIHLVQDLKAGRMTIRGVAGDKVVYHSVDKAFDSDSLRELTAELRRRGVAVRGHAYAVPPAAVAIVSDEGMSAGAFVSRDGQSDAADFNAWLESSKSDLAEQGDADRNDPQSRMFGQ